MTLNQLLTKLAQGVLSNLSIVDTTTSTIKDGKISTVVGFINEGLIELYNQFDLKRDFVYVELLEGKVEYEISSKHQIQEGSLEADYDHYIWKGGKKKFEDDLIKIVNIKSTLTGLQFPLNDETDPSSIYTPTYNTIQVSQFDVRERLIVTYIACHKMLDPEHDLDTVIELPTNLIKALCSYVAYAIHNNMNTQEAVANANKYFSQFSAEINKNLATGNAKSVYTEDTTKFNRRGWV